MVKRSFRPAVSVFLLTLTMTVLSFFAADGGVGCLGFSSALRMFCIVGAAFRRQR